MKFEVGKLYLVDWLDHCSFTASKWRDFEDVNELEPQICSTAGFVTKVQKNHIIISGTQSSKSLGPKDRNYTGELLILKSCILKSKKISLKGW